MNQPCATTHRLCRRSTGRIDHGSADPFLLALRKSSRPAAPAPVRSSSAFRGPVRFPAPGCAASRWRPARSRRRAVASSIAGVQPLVPECFAIARFELVIPCSKTPTAAAGASPDGRPARHPACPCAWSAASPLAAARGRLDPARRARSAPPSPLLASAARRQLSRPAARPLRRRYACRALGLPLVVASRQAMPRAAASPSPACSLVARKSCHRPPQPHHAVYVDVDRPAPNWHEKVVLGHRGSLPIA